MTKYIKHSFVLIFILIGTFLSRQADTVIVPEQVDGEYIGAINKFIDGDTTATGERVNPERYYKLQKNKIYILNGELHTHFNFRLIADDLQDGEKPPIVASNTGADGVIQLIQFKLYGDAYIKNIIFQMTPPTGNGESNASFFLSKEGGTYTFDNVRWEWGLWTSMVTDIPVHKITVSNCYFRNPQHKTNIWNGRGLGFYQENPADTVIVQNNTFFNMNAFAFFADNSSIPPKYLLFDHNTIVNEMKWPIHSYWITHAEVTNNLFYNCNSFGENDEDTEGQDPDRLLYGMINMYPTPQDILDLRGIKEGDRIYTLKNNAYFYSQEIKDYLDSYSLQEEPFMNSRTQAMFDNDTDYPFLTVENTYYTDPGLKEIGESTALMIKWMKRKRDWKQQKYWGWDPDNDKFAVQWPFPEDFTYTNDTLLYGSVLGYPVGDLNWFPVKKAQWETGEPNAVKETALNSNSLSVKNVFPNPFKDQVTFNIELKNTSKIDIDIFDLNGNKLKTIFKGVKNAGDHKITWKVSGDIINNNTANIFIYRIQSKDSVLTGKLNLIK